MPVEIVQITQLFFLGLFTDEHAKKEIDAISDAVRNLIQDRSRSLTRVIILNNEQDNWLIKYSSRLLKPKMNLICFPFAGGGTVNYARWRADLHDDIDLYAINLPGRERLFGRPCLTDYHGLIKSLATLIENRSDCPLVFFGHSFGGLTAYFTALELNKRKGISPVHVYISARTPPGTGEVDKLSDLNQEQFKSILIDRYNGIPSQILSNPDLLNLFIPIIQQDFRMYEQYPNVFQSYENQIINCDITTIRFSEDRPTEELFYEWKNYAKGTHHHRQLTGGHFEILTNWVTIVDLINSHAQSL